MSFKHRLAIIITVLVCNLLSAQDFTADTRGGCSPLSVRFELDDTTSITSVEWDFGNGRTSNELVPPTISYIDPGQYTVSAVINGNTASPIVKTDYISVFESIGATFRIDSINELTYAFIPTGTINNPTNTISFRWDFFFNDTTFNKSFFVSDGNTERARYEYTFPDTGSYGIKLTTNNLISSCIDSDSLAFKVSPSYDTIPDKYVAANVFSPDSPGSGYYIINPNDPAIVLSFEVFTRTGVPVFKTESPVIHWDGRTNDGRQLQTGVYFYVLQAKEGDPDGFYSTKGFIHLFR